MKPTYALWIVVFSLVTTVSLRADNWPGWRGPTGLGQTREKDLPLTWGGKNDDNVLWKVPLLAEGAKVRLDHNQSSPMIWGEHAVVTLSYWPAGKTSKEYPEHHVVCFRKSDGQRLWDTVVPPGGWLLNDVRGGYTVPTPTSDGERIYVAFGSAVIAALDFKGTIVWRKEFDPKNFDVAIGTSPVLHGDTVYMICDKNNRASNLIAYDRKTGNVQWEQKRPTAGFAHSTPVIVDIQGKKQMLVAVSNAVQGLDPATGEVLWRCAGKGDTVSPVIGEGIVYLDSGRGGSGVAVDPTGKGDVTKTHVKWTLREVPEGFSSPVIVGPHLYRLHRPETIGCWNLATGALVYKQRLQGVGVASSPIATPEGRIYCASGGKTHVLQAGPTFKVLAVNDLGDASQASAAVADGKIYLKGTKFLFCVGKK